jgi:hypothetical protein
VLDGLHDRLHDSGCSALLVIMVLLVLPGVV